MLIVCLALIVPLFSFAKPSEKLPLPKELQAGELPWFAVTARDGGGAYNNVINRDNLKEIAKRNNSKGVILAFFATWCVPCREGLKLMDKKAVELKEKGVLVVLVNVGEDDYGKISEWAKQYAEKEWLLGFDKFANLPEKFGLAKQGADMPFPRTLVLDSNLRPLMLVGQEGDDFPQILWSVYE
jgi:thiol-disulfide isomerase/thioredoxin